MGFWSILRTCGAILLVAAGHMMFEAMLLGALAFVDHGGSELYHPWLGGVFAVARFLHAGLCVAWSGVVDSGSQDRSRFPGVLVALVLQALAILPFAGTLVSEEERGTISFPMLASYVLVTLAVSPLVCTVLAGWALAEHTASARRWVYAARHGGAFAAVLIDGYAIANAPFTRDGPGRAAAGAAMGLHVRVGLLLGFIAAHLGAPSLLRSCVFYSAGALDECLGSSNDEQAPESLVVDGGGPARQHGADASLGVAEVQSHMRRVRQQPAMQALTGYALVSGVVTGLLLLLRTLGDRTGAWAHWPRKHLRVAHLAGHESAVAAGVGVLLLGFAASPALVSARKAIRVQFWLVCAFVGASATAALLGDPVLFAGIHLPSLLPAVFVAQAVLGATHAMALQGAAAAVSDPRFSASYWATLGLVDGYSDLITQTAGPALAERLHTYDCLTTSSKYTQCIRARNGYYVLAAATVLVGLPLLWWRQSRLERFSAGNSVDWHVPAAHEHVS